MKVIEEYNLTDREFPYHEAMRAISSADCAAKLVRECPDVNVVDSKGSETLLMIACRKRFVEAIELLFEKGAAEIINHVSILDGSTALHNACYYKEPINDEIVEMLLKHSANVNSKDFLGCTPLYWVMNSFKFHHNFSVIRTIVENGADINAANKNCENILHGFLPDHIKDPDLYSRVTHYLLDSGLSCNLKQFQNYNNQKKMSMLLPIAIKLDDTSLITKLAAKGVKIDFSFRYLKHGFCNPLDLAYLLDSHECVAYLSQIKGLKPTIATLPPETIVKVLFSNNGASIPDFTASIMKMEMSAVDKYLASHRSIIFLISNILYFHSKLDPRLNVKSDIEEEESVDNKYDNESRIYLDCVDTLTNSLSLEATINLLELIGLHDINLVIGNVHKESDKRLREAVKFTVETQAKQAVNIVFGEYKTMSLSYMKMILDLRELMTSSPLKEIRERVDVLDIFNIEFESEDGVIINPDEVLASMRVSEPIEDDSSPNVIGDMPGINES